MRFLYGIKHINSELLLREMAIRGWNRFDLVRESGLGKDYVYRFFAGDVELASKSLKKIADAVGIDMRSLLQKKRRTA